jgi:hypothetical protein
MEPVTIALILAAVAAVAAVFFLGANFAPDRSKAAAKVEALEVQSFRAIVNRTMLEWQDEQAKQAQAIAVQTAALEADRAAFADTQKAIAAMTAGNVPAQS